MDVFPTSLRPLPGGASGETFLAEAAGEQVVVRVYGGRSAARGPQAPEVDAAVLALVRGLLPVPEVLEVRPADPGREMPGLLVTSLLPGERLDVLLPRLGPEERRVVGGHLGTVLGRLGHMAQPRAGLFRVRSLVLEAVPPELHDLQAWLRHHARALGAELVESLVTLADAAQDLLDEDRRACLVHSDLNGPNLLVDPGSLEVTGVLDWEFCHAGGPYEDLGNLLRLERDPAFEEGVLASYAAFMPWVPDRLLDRARAADLLALVDLAGRSEEGAAADRARRHLLAIARAGDLHAVP